MESWQKQNIRKNLTGLLESILCHAVFIAKLQSQEILSDEDVAKMATKGDRYDQAKFLLDVLQTRFNGYIALLKSLQKTKQTGALHILLKKLPSNFLQSSEIDLNGRQFLLGNLLNETQILEVWETLDVFERTNFVVNNLENKKFKLASNTIPPRVPYYIPRTLSKRLCLNKNIFTQNCPDVFVIWGMDRPLLTELVHGQKTACSRDQIDEVTVRFIKLENLDHWKDIRDLSNAPAHLLNYCATESTLTLEETSGGSKILSCFLERQNQDDDCVITKDRLITDMENETSICICDLPGMGKTLLLASLAQHVIKNPNSFPVFIRLQPFIEYLKSQTVEEIQSRKKLHIFKYIAHSVLGARILLKAVESYKITAEFFFDEFDEIGLDNITYAKSLLKSISLEPNIRIYVTSRLHMRHELENALGVISYDILPFCEDNQIDYLTEYWSNIGSIAMCSNLSHFAMLCLQEFKKNVASNERDLAGIPLQCNLIAEIHSKDALRYSKKSEGYSTNTFIDTGKSMFDAYKKYIDLKFAKGVKLIPKSLKESQFSAPCSTIFDELRTNFHELALHVVFSDFAKLRKLQNPLNDSHLITKMMSYGLLEEVYNGKEFCIQFIHKTFAEYLVAEHIASYLSSSFIHNRKCSSSRSLYSYFTALDTQYDLFMNLVFQNVLKRNRIISKNISKRRNLCTFTHSTVVYFFDHQLKMLTANRGLQPTHGMTKYLSSTSICEILESCGYHNFGNVYKFVETICKSNLSKYKSVLSKQMYCSLISVFCEYSSRELLDECITFFNSLYPISLDELFRSFSAELYYYIPIEYACKRRSYDLLEYFLNKNCSSKRKRLVHICIEESVDFGFDTIQRTMIPMVTLLLNNSTSLIQELDSSARTPLLVKRSSHHLVKVLIQKGADLYQRDMNGNTVAHIISDWTSSEDFHALSVFLTEDLVKRKIFNTKNSMGDTPLHCALRCIKEMQTKTVRMILATKDIDVNERNKEEENILISAIKGRQSVELLKVLIELGADIRVRHNNMGWNLLHFAVGTGNFETFYYLLTFGINHRQKDRYGRTPFHIMNTHEVNGCYFIDRIVELRYYGLLS